MPDHRRVLAALGATVVVAGGIQLAVSAGGRDHFSEPPPVRRGTQRVMPNQAVPRDTACAAQVSRALQAQPSRSSVLVVCVAPHG